MEDDECSDQRPLIKTDECTFAYIKHSNLYVVATTRKNSNIAMLFTLLHKICAVMQEYFKEVAFHSFTWHGFVSILVWQVEEESIRDNFVICYELLDELIDFGYPQTTDAKILQEYITQVTYSTDFNMN